MGEAVNIYKAAAFVMWLKVVRNRAQTGQLPPIEGVKS